MRKHKFPVWGQSRREINGPAPAITPTLGSELLTDGGLENWTTPTNLTSWTEQIEGTSTINQDTDAGDVHGGTSACRGDVDASASTASIYQSGKLVAGWNLATAWMKSSAAGKIMLMYANANNQIPQTLTETYAQYVLVAQLGALTALSLGRQTGQGSFSFYLDDVSAKQLTFTSCISRMGNVGHKSGTFQCTPTVTRGAAAGILFNYKDTDNFSMIYTNAASAFLLSCISGTYTVVKSGAITYADGRVLKAIVNGTTVQLFYHGTQVSTNGTIDNSGMGTEVYAFNAYAGDTVGTVTTSKATS